MAAADVSLDCLEDEFRCSLCGDYFEEPVIIHCGHNFCRSCITRDWEQFRDRFPCPLCRAACPEIRLRPNRQLRNAAALFTEELRFQARRNWAANRLCEKHGQRLNLFCEEDRRLICVICRVSRAHRSHSVVSLEEASQGFEKPLETERQKIVAEFQQLHQFLEEQERLLLAQLEELNKEIDNILIPPLFKLSHQ